MFCKKCGREIHDGAAFCPNCGTAIKSTAQTVSAKQNYLMPPIMPALQVSGTNTGSKAPKKKIPVVGIVAAVVFLLILINSAGISNFVHRTFSSPKKYYQYIEKKAINELSGHMGEWYDRYLLDSMNFYDKSIDAKLTVEVEDGGKELLGLLGLAGVDTSWFESISIGADASIKDDKAKAELSFALNGSNLLSCNMAGDLNEGMAYYQIPELNKTYVKTYMPQELLYNNSFGYLYSGMQGSNKKLMQAYPSRKDIKKLSKRYLKLALRSVKNVSKSKEVLEVNGVKQKCTVLQATIDADTMQEMGKAVLKEIRNDKKIKSLMKKMYKAYDSDVDTDEEYKKFQDEIDNTLNQLEYSYYGNAEIRIKIYVDSKGKIRGRSLSFDDTSVNSLMPRKGSRFGYELSGNVDGVNVSLTGSGKISNNKISGDFQVKCNGASLIDVTTNKLNIEDLKSGRLNGSIEVKATSAIRSIVGSIPGVSIIEDIKVKMDFKSSKKSYSCKVGVIYDSQNIGSITASVKTGSGSKVMIPSDKNTAVIENESDFMDWAKDLELDTLIESLKKADVPDEAINALENAGDIGNIYEDLYGIRRNIYSFLRTLGL